MTNTQKQCLYDTRITFNLDSAADLWINKISVR